MACFAATLGIAVLSGLIVLSATNKEACDIYAAIGQSLTLPFVYKGLTDKHVLRWTHNTTIVFYRQNGRVSVGKTGDVSATGALLLKAVQFSSAGDYQANLLHSNGTSAQAWSGRLCVMDKVSKPKLTYVCDSTSSAVNLNCVVAKPQGLVFSWTLDDKTLKSEERQTLSVSLKGDLKGERNFTCSVANRVSEERSYTVRPACKTPSPSAQSKVLCFKPATVVLALAGGLTLILLLLVTVITLCCRRRRNKAQKTLTGKGDVRMLSLNKRGSESVAPDYETMQPTENPSPPSHEPSPRACYQEVSQPDAQSGNKPLDLPMAAEPKQPSPVPKPRTKGPHQTAELT